MAISLAGLKVLRLFPMEVHEGQMFQKNQHTIPELKTAIQSKTEATSTETLTKVLNNFALCLHKFMTVKDKIWRMF
jgi:hypothetical protein